MSLPENFEGKFETLHKISEGGMGEVYKVRHLLLDQIQVIKVIRSQHTGDEEVQRRFRREARTAIRLRHPNIAALHDFSIGEGGTAYIVMEHIDGKTLKSYLEENGPPPVDLTIEIALQSLDALSYLHRRGYVHRDISPDNLMLTESYDGGPLIKLIDLGLAKNLVGPSDLTATGMFIGKARYSSPEQFEGGEIDQRTDIYSFGVMLYELLTGACPIQGEDFSTLVASHLFRPPLDFEASDPQGRIPPQLRAIVLRAIEKKPADRFATAAELAQRLEAFRSLGKFGGAVIDSDQATVVLPTAPGAAGEVGAGTAAAAATPAGAATVPIPSPAPMPERPAEGVPRPRKRGKLKLFLGLAAALALPLGWWALSSRSPAPPLQIPAAEESYLSALEQLSGGELLAALQLLRAARDAEASASPSPGWVTPGRKGPYVPYFQLGLVYFKMNNCVEALDAWAESERQGVIQNLPQYEELKTSRSECEKRYAETVQLSREALDNADRYADLLDTALVDPKLESLRQGSPQLVADVRAALQGFRGVQTRFEQAEARKDYRAILSLETELVESEERLNKLLDEF